MFYEIADDVHWLILTDVKHIKKSVLYAQGTFTNATYKQTADLSLYTWYLKTQHKLCVHSSLRCHHSNMAAVISLNAR